MPLHDLDPAVSDRCRSGERLAPDHDLGLELVRVTEIAALAAGRWSGLGDERRGTRAAVAAARLLLRSVPFQGTVVTGGRGDALFVDGEQVGSGVGPACDVAVDPLDGARLVAAGMPNALAVIVATERGAMYRPSPITAMEMLVVGPDAAGVVDIDRPVADNVRAVATATRRPTSAITAAVLDRPRHQEIVRQVRETGARVRCISGGDVASALAVSCTGSGVDMLLGVGGAQQGILAAAALACTGGTIQARLRPRDVGERHRAIDAGLDIDSVLHTGDLVDVKDTIFCATGVTDGPVVPGVRHRAAGATTTSVAMRSSTGTVRVVEGRHRWDGLRQLVGADLGLWGAP
jgi:fructose-1,6-bisphosphatase II